MPSAVAVRSAHGVSPAPAGRARPLRILMVSPQPFFQPRGTPLSVYFRLRALSALGHAVDLATYPIGRDVAIPGVRIVRSARVPFVNRVGIGPSFKKAILDVSLRRTVAELARSGRYDAIHSHEEAAFFGWRIARDAGLRHVYDMHSLLSEQLGHFPVYRLAPFRGMMRRMERRAVENSDVLITISAGLRDLARKLFPRSEPVLIENMVDEADFGPVQRERLFANEDRGALRERLGLPRDGLVALYAGSLAPYQGMDLLLSAARAVREKRPDVSFVVIGGEPRQTERLRREARDGGLSSSFLVPGLVEPERVPEYLEAADILLSPRAVGSNVPSKIYSYLKSGRPVVATGGSPHDQILSERFAVLTAPDAASYSEGILRLASDAALRARLGRAAADEARERYNLRRFLDATADALRPL